MKNEVGLGRSRKASGLVIAVALVVGGCYFLPARIAYFDITTYKNLTEVKPEILFLYDTVTSDEIDQASINEIKLRLAQIYEYEKGKGEENTETARQVEIIANMFSRHIEDRLGEGPWTLEHRENQKGLIAEALDIAIATETMKNRRR